MEYKNSMTDWIHDMEVKIFLYVGRLMSSNTAESMEWQHDGVLDGHITDWLHCAWRHKWWKKDGENTYNENIPFFCKTLN